MLLGGIENSLSVGYELAGILGRYDDDRLVAKGKAKAQFVGIGDGVAVHGFKFILGVDAYTWRNT